MGDEHLQADATHGPRPLIISGPSGAGKSTLINQFLFKDPLLAPRFGFSVSHTTRRPRAGERDGVDYHFVQSTAAMNELASGHSRKAGPGTPFFLERATVHDHEYEMVVVTVVFVEQL